MPDDKTKTGSPDSKRINVNEAHELRDWSKDLGVSKDELKDIVDKVGDSAAAVKQYIKDNKK